jgi:hypothetical protein
MCKSVVDQDQVTGGEGDEPGGKVDGRSEVVAVSRCHAAVDESGPDASRTCLAGFPCCDERGHGGSQLRSAGVEVATQGFADDV